MLIKFKDICDKYGVPKGIIHIGAHLCEERNDYLSKDIKNIIWVEANPNLYDQISSLNKEDGEYVINALLSDVDNVETNFNITNNGQSSSILELDKHKHHHPWVNVTSIIKLKSKRMDTLINKLNINISNFNFLNIDVQGADLMVLMGFGELLNNIDQIYIEVNTDYLYKDCPLLSDIDEYLSKFRFKRVELSMTEWEWGDALYIKEKNEK
jgi:FkbM family methyltransferase